MASETEGKKSDPKPEKKQSGLSVLLNFVVACAVIFFGIQRCTEGSKSETSSAQSSKPVVSTNIRALVTAFNANEIRASEVTKGKQLKFSGAIQKLALDALDDPYLMVDEVLPSVPVETNDPFAAFAQLIEAFQGKPSISAHFPGSAKGQLAAWDKGQVVELTCQSVGLFMGSLAAQDCTAQATSVPKVATRAATSPATVVPEAAEASPAQGVPTGKWVGHSEGTQTLIIQNSSKGLTASLDGEGQSAGGGACSGGVQGVAQWNAKTNTVTVADARSAPTDEKPSPGEECTFEVTFVGDKASATVNNHCGIYHGACSGLGGDDLVKQK